MIPISDSHKTFKPPYITYALVAINVLVFIAEFSASNIDQFITTYSFIPNLFSFFDINTWWPMFTAAFMHGGISHILFNMLFLWVFGDNVEEDLGIIKYILFYFGAIISATLLQYVVDPTSMIPNLGASGAIAGILGYYLVKFPKHPINTLMFFGGRIFIREYPANFFLGYWTVTQFFSGFGSLAGTEDGGVAWFAHIGGLLFGVAIGYLIRAREDKMWGQEYI